MRHRFPLIASLVCVAVSVVYLLPQILFQQPNILDVAETWAFGQDVVGNGIAELSNTQRFRPLYVFERTFMNALFSYRPPLYFLFFSLLLSITMYTGYLILKKDGRDTMVYGFIGFLFLISPVTVDTFWRLGTAENLFALALIASLYTLLRQQYTLLIFWLFMLMGSKETAVFVIPIFITALWFKKRYWEAALVTVGYLAFALKIYSLIRYTHENIGSYTALFSVIPGSVGDMFVYYTTSYVFYVALFLFACAHVLYRKRFHKRSGVSGYFEWEYFYIILILSNLISLLFFRNKFQPYYFFPVLSVLLLIVGHELHLATPVVKRVFVLYTCILFIVICTFQQTWERVRFWQREYAGDGALFAYMKKEASTRKFSFVYAYRPEISSVLEIWYHIHPQPADTENTAIIELRDPSQQSSGSPLCGRTFFGESSCKWQIVIDSR